MVKLHALCIHRIVTRGTDESQSTSGGVNRIEVTIILDGIELTSCVAGNASEAIAAGGQVVQGTSAQIKSVKVAAIQSIHGIVGGIPGTIGQVAVEGGNRGNDIAIQIHLNQVVVVIDSIVILVGGAIVKTKVVLDT